MNVCQCLLCCLLPVCTILVITDFARNTSAQKGQSSGWGSVVPVLLPVVVCMAIIAFTDVSASINYKEASCMFKSGCWHSVNVCHVSAWGTGVLEPKRDATGSTDRVRSSLTIFSFHRPGE